jgi:hypothetical protein
MPPKIAEPWLSFLREVDRALGRPVSVHCLGGFVLAVLWDLPRPTGDVDFIEAVPSDAASELLGIAGEGSELASRYKLHFHRVTVAEFPEGYVARLVDITPRGLEHLRLLALEAHDLALAKLGRNSPRDRSDVQFLAGKGALDRRQLRERFESELLPYVLNAARPPVSDNGLGELGSPLHLQFPAVLDAVPEVEVDQVLIRDPRLGRHRLEVGHDVLVQADRDRLLEVLDVGVLLTLHLGEVVVFSHRCVSQ